MGRIAASGKGVGGGIVDDVDFWHGEPSCDGEVFDGIIEARTIFFFDFFAAGHHDSKFAGGEILDEGIDGSNHEEDDSGLPVAGVDRNESADGGDKENKADHNKDGGATICGDVFIHSVIVARVSRGD